jgi:GntR family transcriptional regulator, transcriptional repressor for pyruvate dehydrogenase complex
MERDIMDGSVQQRARMDETRRALLRDALRCQPPLTERALAARLGVTRHALRRVLSEMRQVGEALQSPRSQRAAKPLHAASALLAQDTNPVEILEIRLALEPALARLAAMRATPTTIARILRAATTPVGADVIEADIAFHTAVAGGARNGLAAALYEVLRRISEAERHRLSEDLRDAFAGDRVSARDAEHRKVAEAIAARDADAAEACMRAHLRAVSRTMAAHLTAFR